MKGQKPIKAHLFKHHRRTSGGWLLLQRAGCILLGTLLFTLSLLPSFTTVALAAPDWPSNVSIGADAGILIDADSGAVLYGKNIHGTYPPASITKLLTALVVAEHGGLDEMVTFSEDAVNNVESGSGNKSNVVVGDILPVKDLLYSMMLLSCNQSANALAEHVGGSRDAFVEMMNEKIAALGCTDSRFANPSGLNDDNQYVSAYDMALIAQAAFANPTVFEAASAKTYDMSGTTNNPNGWTIYMEHKLLISSKPSSQYYYPDVKAGKIGYTSKAGNTMATYASRDGQNLIAVVLKGTQPQYYMDAKSLFDFGFANFDTLRAPDYENSYTTGEVPVSIGGKDYSPSDLSIEQSGAVTLPKGAAFEDAQKELVTAFPSQHPQGAAAQIRYTYNGNNAGTVWLIAREPETVPETTAAQTQPVIQTAEAPQGEKGSFPLVKVLLGIGLAAVGLAAAAFVYITLSKKREAKELEQRRERRKERLREMGCSEEEFERMVKERKSRR